jgi:hypothetical protein
MKRICVFLIACLLQANLTFASKEVVAQVKAQFEAQGVDLRGSCGAFYITNEVAKRTGTKLLKKVPGQNRAIPGPNGTCKTPEQAPGENGYAVEYLITLPSGFGYDILGDSGGDNSPRWAEETNKAERNLKNWAEPIALNVGGGAPPVPQPDPTTPPVSSELLERVTRVEQTTNSIYAQAVDTATRLQAHIDSTEAFQQTVGREWKKFGAFIGKYVLPLVGGILGGKYLFGDKSE